MGRDSGRPIGSGALMLMTDRLAIETRAECGPTLSSDSGSISGLERAAAGSTNAAPTGLKPVLRQMALTMAQEQIL
jgi:hypothetical protein